VPGEAELTVDNVTGEKMEILGKDFFNYDLSKAKRTKKLNEKFTKKCIYFLYKSFIENRPSFKHNKY
jgi:hypothetical protein